MVSQYHFAYGENGISVKNKVRHRPKKSTGPHKNIECPKKTTS